MASQQETTGAAKVKVGLGKPGKISDKCWLKSKSELLPPETSRKIWQTVQLGLKTMTSLEEEPEANLSSSSAAKAEQDGGAGGGTYRTAALWPDWTLCGTDTRR